MDLKILTVGNSFSICLGKNLPQIVRSVSGHSLKLASAYIGGCSLAQHSKNIREAEKDPSFRPYRRDVWFSDPEKAPEQSGSNLEEMLAEDRWDIVTIQQASHCSWNPDTWQPYADHVISFIRARAPQAKIMIQQTWAYRADDPRISRIGGFSWGFDQEEMYRRLSENYRTLARAYSFPLIPTGYAVQLTRRNDPLHFCELSAEEKAKLHWPDLPPQAGDPVGASSWHKDPETGELVLGGDSIHLNVRGEYLQACVFFAFLFDRTEKIAYDSPSVGRSDCAFLREMAQQAVDGFPSPQETA